MNIEFTAIYGEETKKVVLFNPHGAGDTWHIMIDNYYNGVIFKRGEDWVSYSNSIYGDDVYILGEIIEGEIKKPFLSQIGLFKS